MKGRVINLPCSHSSVTVFALPFFHRVVNDASHRVPLRFGQAQSIVMTDSEDTWEENRARSPDYLGVGNADLSVNSGLA